MHVTYERKIFITLHDNVMHSNAQPSHTVAEWCRVYASSQRFDGASTDLMGNFFFLFFPFPGWVFQCWHRSAAAVATVVNNIWACYLSSELENSQLQPLAH